MAMLLARMPWNQVKAESCATSHAATGGNCR
jgi:hypothetical protein